MLLLLDPRPHYVPVVICVAIPYSSGMLLLRHQSQDVGGADPVAIPYSSGMLLLLHRR